MNRFRIIYMTTGLCLWMTLSLSAAVVNDCTNSMFAGMGASVNLNASSIKITDGTLASWDDALGSQHSYVARAAGRNGTVGTMTIGGNDFVAVQFAGGNSSSSTALVDSTSQTFKTLFMVNSLGNLNDAPGCVFGRDQVDFGIRVPSQNFGYANTDDYATSTGYIAVNGTNADNESGVWTQTGSAAKPNLMSATSSNEGVTGGTALGHYIDVSNYHTRCLSMSVAEFLTFPYILSPGEIKIVNTMLSTYYGLADDMAEGSIYALNQDFNQGMFYLGATTEDNNTGHFNVTNNGSNGFGIELIGESVFATTADDNGIIVGYCAARGKVVWNVNDLGNFDLSDTAEVMLTFDLTESGITPSDQLFLNYDDGSGIWSKLAADLELTGNHAAFTLAANNFLAGTYALGVPETQGVPEPATWVMLLLGCGLLFLRRVGVFTRPTNP